MCLGHASAAARLYKGETKLPAQATQPSVWMGYVDPHPGGDIAGREERAEVGTVRRDRFALWRSLYHDMPAVNASCRAGNGCTIA